MLVILLKLYKFIDHKKISAIYDDNMDIFFYMV